MSGEIGDTKIDKPSGHFIWPGDPDYTPEMKLNTEIRLYMHNILLKQVHQNSRSLQQATKTVDAALAIDHTRTDGEKYVKDILKRFPKTKNELTVILFNYNNPKVYSRKSCGTRVWFHPELDRILISKGLTDAPDIYQRHLENASRTFTNRGIGAARRKRRASRTSRQTGEKQIPAKRAPHQTVQGGDGAKGEIDSARGKLNEGRNRMEVEGKGPRRPRIPEVPKWPKI